MRIAVGAMLAVLSICFSANAQECEFTFWRDYKGDPLMRHASADAPSTRCHS